MGRGWCGRGYSGYRGGWRSGSSYSYTKPKSKPKAPAGPPAKHYLEYAKSGRSACHGEKPCKGSNIDMGTMRYGQLFLDVRKGESYPLWRHWGCVTPEILNELAAISVTQIHGWKDIATADKEKVKAAIKAKKVADADIPASARPLDWAQLNNPPPVSQPAMPPRSSQVPMSSQAQNIASSSGVKRKAEQPPASQSYSQPPATQIIDVDEIPDVDNLEDIASDELYVTLPTNIVGIQYYTGLVGMGENVRLDREPTNQYDANAIRALNIGGRQVGHLPRNVAAKLAPLLDKSMVTVEGVMSEGNLNLPRGTKKWNLNIALKIYGPAFMRPQLEPLLIWATPGQRGFTDAMRQAARPQTFVHQMAPTPSQVVGPPASQNSKAQADAIRAQREAQQRAFELQNMLSQLKHVNDETRRSNMFDSVFSNKDVLELPLFENPPSVETGELKVNLLKHQLQGLKWCYDHEYPKLPTKETDKPVQFWTFKKNGAKQYYYNIATSTPQDTAPVLGKGALMADAMGLGKTLTMIALILATKNDNNPDFAHCTLVVAPVSVISNWSQQIRDHCTSGILKVHEYHGSGRNMTAAEMKKYDVIVTSYGMVVGDWERSGLAAVEKGGETKTKKTKYDPGLFGVKWKRIILDEGHTIRNPSTKQAKAACALDADRRWVITGTPILNSSQDLGSILKFLRICFPLSDPVFFKSCILRPIDQGDSRGAELMKALMSHVCIRRTKEMQDAQGNRLVPLPPVEIVKIPVTLHQQAQELYDAVEAITQQKVGDIIRGEGGTAARAHMLGLITRLRQITCHPGLVPSNLLEQLQAQTNDEHAPFAPMSPAEKIRLQGILAKAIEEAEECAVCLDILKNPRITPCAHWFCLTCITTVLKTDEKCPMDRRPLFPSQLIEPPEEGALAYTQAPIMARDEDDATDLEEIEPSAKVDQLVHLLKLFPVTDKSLVFSSFTKFLDTVAKRLDEEGIPYVRYDGSMSARQRDEVVERFNVPLTGDRVPLARTATAPKPTPASVAAAASATSGRRRAATQRVVFDSDALDFGTVENLNGGTGGGASGVRDSDFVVEISSSDDEFVADDSDDDVGGYGDAEDDDEDEDFSEEEGKGRNGKKSNGKNGKKSNGNGKDKAKGKGKGKGKGKVTTASSRSSGNGKGSGKGGEIPVVMLCSLKAAALGLNLTVANRVFLLDPWWQEGIESQAIDRCNRIGQKKDVFVYQMIAENTIESRVLEIQERKKTLVAHAFSGTKAVETQRLKREARLQDLVELFRPRAEATT